MDLTSGLDHHDLHVGASDPGTLQTPILLESLPKELLAMCLSYVPPASLSCVARVSKNMNNVATTQLYKNIDLSNLSIARRDQINSLFVTIATRPGLRKEVENLSFNVIGFVYAKLSPIETETILEVLRELFPADTGLTEESKMASKTWHDTLFDPGDVSAHLAYMVCLLPNLKSLVCDAPFAR